MNSIYVQVASYRDSELLPTLRDLRAKSSGKNKINIGICWQKDDSETIEEFQNDPDVRILSVPWNESKGLGWARSEIQKMYQDEDYTLQLDSHHRFSKDWDVDLIKMYKSLKGRSEKPLLTAYAASYDPLNDKVLNPTPSWIWPHDFKSSGTIWFNPVSITNWNMIEGPIRGRLVSGHYYFTTGAHCKEYIYDPDMYFAGDEICLSVRSYTLGYDIWHPHRCYVWHHYGRTDRAKHWTDHAENNKKEGKIKKSWNERDEWSKKRIRHLLGEENNNIDLGIYGLGDKRTLADYELYSGIDFRNRRITRDAIEGREPPVIYKTEDLRELAFKKTTPIKLVEWPYMEYMKTMEKISHIDVKFFNLQQKVIFTDTISVPRLLSMMGRPYEVTIVGDYYPMKLSFNAMNKDVITNSWVRDLKPNIHWG